MLIAAASLLIVAFMGMKRCRVAVKSSKSEGKFKRTMQELTSRESQRLNRYDVSYSLRLEVLVWRAETFEERTHPPRLSAKTNHGSYSFSMN